ncbi:MAG TPA: methyl-accepting chemotaxis protein, partial [Spirochaetota bacterium]|nr:methyl-accepting chemotaxis protein [Spirochaetota bacterium]
MFNSIRKSISKQVSLILVVIITVAIGSIGIYDFINTNDKLSKNLEKITKDTNERLVVSLKTHIWNFNKIDTLDIIELEMRTVEIYSIIALNPDKTLFAGKKRDKDWNVENIEFFDENEDKEEYANFIYNELNIKEDDNLLGIIKVYITDKYKKDQLLRSLIMNILMIICVSFILVLSITFFLKRILIYPMKQVTEKFGYLSNGDLTLSFQSNSLNELGVLSNNIDIFVTVINGIIRELSETGKGIDDESFNIQNESLKLSSSSLQQLKSNENILSTMETFSSIFNRINLEIEKQNENSY